jgi:hypothetical protein
MAETAVGLFEHPGTADAVVDALRASGVPSRGIRVLSKPAAFPVDSPADTPSVDFAASLAQDLRSMGATDYECKAYLSGVRRGNVLVFATGSHAQADAAISVMNAYDPLQIEELASVVPVLPGMRVGQVVGGRRTGSGIGAKDERARSEGARVFNW